mmetsp:Transcript_99045/g.288900  ORF Transcript_99045/g.288900 Transcript_99045/m.288900 type:complete len:222 (+) Transcript_99045:292-957(+)
MRLDGVSRFRILPPFPSTKILSHLSTKRRRCAMERTVASAQWVPITRRSWSAVLQSREAVHSSRTSTFGRRTSARAVISICSCPMEMPDGASSDARASPSVSLPVSCRASRPQCTSAVATSASVNSSPPRLALRLMRNIAGSCGTSAIARRSPDSFRPAMSTPSSNTRPVLYGGTPLRGPRRRRRLARVDLPAPVLPTMPSFSCACTSRLTWCRAAGKCGA